jgi:pSer/pThr/pTyr-binding forkhead associated (FHA) protein
MMMNACPVCQAINLDNANFCSNCGQPLSVRDGLKNAPLADNLLETNAVEADRETDPVADETAAALAQQASETAILRPVPAEERDLVAIRFRIGDNRREIVVPLDKTIHIGRQDPSLDLFPEIDVTNDGPVARSVSRRHAKISKQDNFAIIVDQGSSNGTFVNQKKLKPFEYSLLRAGDVVFLGKLRLEIEFIVK